MTQKITPFLTGLLMGCVLMLSVLVLGTQHADATPARPHYGHVGPHHFEQDAPCWGNGGCGGKGSVYH